MWFLALAQWYRPRVDARQSRLRRLPKIDELLRREDVRAVAGPRWALVQAVREEVDRLRSAILDGNKGPSIGEPEPEIARIELRVGELTRAPLCRVINATGVVLHTNLGRAPMANEAVRAVEQVARGYSNLEYDLDAGSRGSRHGHLTEILRQLTGAEDALIVNNNAGAVLLALAALASGKAAVVSRGELVEIGGSFRIPDVMAQSGARLVEVGSTNKTKPSDYRRAIADDTALLLKVHRSNFRIVGFTEEVTVEQLATIGKEAGVATMMDLGSGSLLDRARQIAMGLPEEPDVRTTVATGVDVVTFSGDKLLGGPQAGIIVGTRDAVARLRSHPLCRALRPDKMTLAALYATLRLYRDECTADIPTLAMLSASADELAERAGALARLIGERGGTCQVIACQSAVGGGALPGAQLPSSGVAIGGASPDRIDAALRRAPTPIIGRTLDDRFILDVRTITDDDFDAIAEAVSTMLPRTEANA